MGDLPRGDFFKAELGGFILSKHKDHQCMEMKMASGWLASHLLIQCLDF